MRTGSVWEELGPLIERLQKELRMEEHAPAADASLVNCYKCVDQILDTVIKEYEGANHDGPTHRRIERLSRHLSDLVVAGPLAKQKAPIVEFISALDGVKGPIARGVVDKRGFEQLFEVMLSRIREVKFVEMSGKGMMTAKLLADARKENALLQQRMSFLQEEIIFLKQQEQMKFRRDSLQKQLGVDDLSADTAISKITKFRGTGLLADHKHLTIEEGFISSNFKTPPQTSTHKNSQIIKVPVPENISDGSQRSILEERDSILAQSEMMMLDEDRKKTPSHLRSKGRLSGISGMSQKDKNSPLQNRLANSVVMSPSLEMDNIIRENRDLRELVGSLKVQLESETSRLKDVIEEKDHMIRMLHIDNTRTTEMLNKELNEIKETYKLEKEGLLAKLDDEVEKGKTRFRELDQIWIQKTHSITEESESRYGEMKVSLHNALENKSRETKRIREQLKDVEDLRRMEALRYETKVQELRTTIRKLEVKIEALKRKIKDEEPCSPTTESQAYAGSPLTKQKDPLLAAGHEISRFLKIYDGSQAKHRQAAVADEGSQSKGMIGSPDLVSPCKSRIALVGASGTVYTRKNLADSLKNSSFQNSKQEYKHRSPAAETHDGSLSGVGTTSMPNVGGMMDSRLMSRRDTDSSLIEGALHKPHLFRSKADESMDLSRIKQQVHMEIKPKSKVDTSEDSLHLQYYVKTEAKTPSGSHNWGFSDIGKAVFDGKLTQSESYQSQSNKKSSTVGRPLDYFIKKKQSLQEPQSKYAFPSELTRKASGSISTKGLGMAKVSFL